MKQEQIDALVSYRMERSRESIEAARLMLTKGMLTVAMNRVYYGMIYAVQAVISHSGVTFSKHGQVKGYFHAYPVGTYSSKR